MQVDGMREFFSKIAPLNEAAEVRRNTLLSALPALAQQTQPSYDSLFLSDIGKKLSVTVRESSSLIETRDAELAEIAALPPWAQQADKAMAKAMDILERMQKLAIAAQNKKLSDIDRVEMQIEIEDLRANFMAIPRNLKGVRPSIVPNLADYGDYGYGDYSSVLGRMRERIMNGQEWNVREAWCPESFTRVTSDENGEEVWEVVAAKAWHVVDDKDILTFREGENVGSGKKVLTVREVLEWATPVIVMDAESAVKGAEYLEQQMAKIQQWRDELPANLEKRGMEGAIYLLETIAVPGGDYKPLLTDPTNANEFLFSDGTYDYRYAMRNSFLESDGSDPLTEGEVLRNHVVARGWFNQNANIQILWYSGSSQKLREEFVTTVPPEDAKVIHVKGVGSLTK